MIIREDEKKIVKGLIDGKVIAIKTDTVYGLICNAFDKNATEKIYDIKKREHKKPIAIFIKSIDDIKNYVDLDSISNKAIDIMKKKWPGALTIIFKKKKGILDNITCCSEYIGIRIPNDELLLSVMSKTKFPLAETSCNISGEREYTNASTINDKLGSEIDYIVDGGEIINNVASTVIKIENDDINVIRQGDIKIDE